jgi:hypothetical protein
MNRLFSLNACTATVVIARLFSIVNVFKGKGYGSSEKGKRE